MTDMLIWAYPWTLVLHLLSVISWMAGLFYLPRLFVYHTEAVERGSATDLLFQTMERRLLRGIMNPAMTATWIFGLCLVFTPGLVDWTSLWPWTKAIGVIGMTTFHHWLGYRRKDFVKGETRVSGRGYRLANEIPTVFLILIVISVIIRF